MNMKYWLGMVALVLATDASACLQNGPTKICANQIVFSELRSTPLRVVAINQFDKFVSVEDYDNSVSTFKPTELSVTSGCVRGICVGDGVHASSLYSYYGRVVAVNPTSKKIIVTDGPIISNNPNVYITSYESSQLAVTAPNEEYSNSVRNKSMK